jgi:hypothetical protein
MEYPDCFHIIESAVKPERMRNNRKVYRDRWWHFAEKRPDLYQTIHGMDRVLVKALTSKHHGFVFASTDLVIDQTALVFVFEDTGTFASLQSDLHGAWSLRYGGTLETRPRYSLSECFETFPFPESSPDLSQIGEQYYAHRRHIMLTRNEGLTKTYNRFHDRTEFDSNIQKLRRLHIEIDHAVAAAYGWTDLDLGHDFQMTKQGVRYTINEAPRREVLARLLKLNHERFDEEVRQGLHETKHKRKTGERKPKGKAVTAKPTPVSIKQSLLDLDGVDPVFPTTEWEKVLCSLLCDLVAAQPGLPATAYLDALVIALRPQRHARLLVGTERKEFTTLAEKLPTAETHADATLPWSLLRDTLTDEAAIRLGNGDLLFRGDRLGERRKAYPSCEAKLVRLIHKAAANLREYQGLASPTSADGQEALAAFDEDKRILCGTT